MGIENENNVSNVLVDIKKQYNDMSRRFSEECKNLKTSKDDDAKPRLRPLAQAVFGLNKTLCEEYKRIIENLEESTAIPQEQLGKLKAEFNQLQTEQGYLEKHLKNLGSVMSGIPDTTFDDIAGLEDVKESIKNYLFLLKDPVAAKKYGISTNLGILLYGPPGTGKTLVAEAIAHELNLRYFVITPSQIFGSYVGESERNIRDVFAELRACTEGSVLLVDECESIFARRDNTSNRAAIGVANQLLQEMNGQGQKGSKRIILGATNRPELIDEAYLRFKRFSMQFYIGMPNDEALRRVVELNFKKHPLYEPMAKDYLLRELLSPKYKGAYTCADISGIIERCAYFALEEYRKKLGVNAESDYVRISDKHIRQVLDIYPKSVTQDMLTEYENFRDSHIQV